MPPMQSMFGGMRAAGQATTSQDPRGRNQATTSQDPEIEGPEKRDPRGAGKESEVEGPKDQVEGPEDLSSQGYAKPNGPHMPDVHRYRNGKLVHGLGTPHPPKPKPKPVKVRPVNPIGDRTYKEPGSGYARGRAIIDAAKAHDHRYG